MDSSHVCWARGRLLSRSDVHIEPAERAFRYGDGVFATLRLRGGVLLDAADHLRRLHESASRVGLRVPEVLHTVDDLVRVVERMEAHRADAVLRVQVSAGPGGRGFGRSGTEGLGPSWELIEVLEVPAERRLTVATLADGEVPTAALPAVKSCSALPHVLCAAAATRRGVIEALRVTDGRLLEAAAANLFWVDGEALHTPSASLPIYPGITRSRVIEIARREGWEVSESRAGPAALEKAAAAFLTNATRGIEPIAELDGRSLEWPARLTALRKAVDLARARAGHHAGPKRRST